MQRSCERGREPTTSDDTATTHTDVASYIAASAVWHSAQRCSPSLGIAIVRLGSRNGGGTGSESVDGWAAFVALAVVALKPHGAHGRRR